MKKAAQSEAYNYPNSMGGNGSGGAIDGKSDPHIEATEDKSWFKRLCPCLHPSAIAPYFDISTADFLNRFKASLMPFNQRFYQEYAKKPDLYGPFWILQTLVVVLTIAHNLSKYLEMPDKKKSEFRYDFAVVPISVGVLFGVTIGLPIIIKIVIQCFGDKPSSVPFLHGFGIYCYSFSSFLLSSLLCGAFAAEWL